MADVMRYILANQKPGQGPFYVWAQYHNARLYDQFVSAGNASSKQAIFTDTLTSTKVMRLVTLGVFSRDAQQL